MMAEGGAFRLRRSDRLKLLGRALGIVMVALALGASPCGNAAAQEGAPGTSPTAQTDSELYFDANVPVLYPGERLYVEVRIDVRDLYGFDYRVSFDPDVLRVVDVDPDTPGDQIQGPSAPVFSSWQELTNSADNVLGTIDHVMFRMPESPRVNLYGGMLSRITFEAKALEDTTLTFVANESSIVVRDPEDPNSPGIVSATTWRTGQIVFGNAHRVQLPLVVRNASH